MKVFKIIGKTVAWILIVVIAILAVLCIVTLCWGAAQRMKGKVTENLPSVPEDFVPTVRLVAFTDTHNVNDRVAAAIDKAYLLYDVDPVYAGVDGFFGLGDFTSVGGEGDFKNYADTIHAHVRPETKNITILGNHEMKNKDEYNDLFKKYFGHDPNTVTEINGFSCIAFSGERSLTEWTFTPSSLKWAKEQLDIAEEKAGDRPIFVFQHPHNFGTVYGSSVWCNFQTNVLWNGHNKVVNFSGHSHFPMNDPRSINQSSYTSVGIGAMARFELENNYIVGQHPDGYDTAAQMCIIEANDKGSVRISGFDLNSDSYFCDYFIENVNDPDSFAYTYKNMRAHDSKPVFKENAQAKAYRDGTGEWILSFDEATCNFIVHDYKVVIKDEKGKTVLNKNFISDYYLTGGDEKTLFKAGKDTFEAGKTYTMKVTAKSAYHLKSDVFTMTFTAQGEINPS